MSPVAKLGHVHSDHQGSEPQGFDPLDQLLVELPISLHIELEPPEASGRRGDDVLQGAAGVRAGDVAGAGRLGSCRANGTTQGGGQGHSRWGQEAPGPALLLANLP